jgi:hypothetical protein
MLRNPNKPATIAELIADKLARIEKLHDENTAPETGGFVRRLAAELAQREAR